MIYQLASYSVAEAIQDVSLANPTYTKILINPTSFNYFIKGLGSKEVFIFGNWSKKRDHFIFDNFKLKLKLYPDKTVPCERAFFLKKNAPLITVELSG